MIKVNVIFEFESKEKWHEFRERISNMPQFPVNSCYLSDGEFPLYYVIFSTKSKKLLASFNEWVINNNYEDYYRLWGNEYKLELDIPELLQQV